MAAQKRLNRDDLVTTALAVADAEGLDAVTVRRVAQLHGVTPMALYRHFEDKDGLLLAIAERLLAGTVLPAPDDRPWYEQLRDLLGNFVDALRPHPNAALLVFQGMVTTEPGLAVTERSLELMAQGGMSAERSAECASQILGSLVALALAAPVPLPGPDPEAREDEVRAKRATLLALSPRRYPHIVAAADTLAACSDPELYFDRGVDMVVTGIRDAARAEAAAAGH
ncbi:TetR/AcrR family transcriptional regulator [Actinacidiphila epipremni]|uniref:TetR family transcriptional regulator n=1 Tax=Actinacidiphila epipremni TaxID=2053013 RepID=A0ABX0ZMP2_9ACTN|nr:TetR/AcrR family transcriptional regulator C-terminal domain-containing protein [Actinacidiphila epipremni]NJP45100.1 TetR family transcriptional regulator [Actinacidiphila epipremni]